MRLLCLFALLVASASIAAAQTDSNSLTITASRSLAVQADQLVFAVTVNSSLNTGLDDVLAALAGLGVAAGNLQSVYSYTDSSNQATLDWTFTLPVGISEAKTTITLLEGLRQTIGTKSPGLTLSYQSQGTRVSGPLQNSQQCSLPDLIGDARAQAQRLVSGSAGLSVGPILALSDGSSDTVQGPNYAIGINGAVQGFSFVIVGSYASFLLGSTAVVASPQNCTVVVKFSLLHY